MQSLDWSKLVDTADKGSGSGMTAGDYPLEAESAEMKQASTGSTMVVVKFRVTGGTYDGLRLYRNFVITPDNPKALAMFFRQMDALGASKEFFMSGPSPQQISTVLVGKRCMGTIKIETGQYAGPKIDSIKALSGAFAAPPSAAPAGPPAGMIPPPPPPMAAPPAAPAAPPIAATVAAEQEAPPAPPQPAAPQPAPIPAPPAPPVPPIEAEARANGAEAAVPARPF